LIREERGHFTISDRGSTWGTYVNGNRLGGPRLLAPDDVIDIGGTRLRFITARAQGVSGTISPRLGRDATRRFDDARDRGHA
jgi:pSer/pThr/pTyr-binding forkhead associated (FHA) protein